MICLPFYKYSIVVVKPGYICYPITVTYLQTALTL